MRRDGAGPRLRRPSTRDDPQREAGRVARATSTSRVRRRACSAPSPGVGGVGLLLQRAFDLGEGRDVFGIGAAPAEAGRAAGGLADDDPGAGATVVDDGGAGADGRFFDRARDLTDRAGDDVAGDDAADGRRAGAGRGAGGPVVIMMLVASLAPAAGGGEGQAGERPAPLAAGRAGVSHGESPVATTDPAGPTSRRPRPCASRPDLGVPSLPGRRPGTPAGHYRTVLLGRARAEDADA